MKPNTCNPIEQIAGKALFQTCAPNLCRGDLLTSIYWQLIRLAFNHQEKFVKSGYKHVGIWHCVFCMPIPLRVCLAGALTKCKLFLIIYGTLKNTIEPFTNTHFTKPSICAILSRMSGIHRKLHQVIMCCHGLRR